MTVLASQPNDPYFHTWPTRPETYKITRKYTSELLRGNDGRFEGRVPRPVFDQTQSSFAGTQTYVHYPSGSTPENWYHQNVRGSQPQNQVFTTLPQTGYSGRDRNWDRQDAGTYRFVAEEDFVGSESYGNNNYGGYSSHVNCQVPNQRTEVDGNGRAYPDHREGHHFSERGIDDTSRHIRNGYPREVQDSTLKVLNPKAGGRHPHGNPTKNQNNNRRATNVIPTTEKTFRNQTQKGSKRPGYSSKPQEGAKIIFPDVFRPHKLTPKGPLCGKETTFCEDIGDEYPSDYVNRILKKEGSKFREFFREESISESDIAERFNAPDEHPLCPYRRDIKYPRQAMNKNGKWPIIVNQDEIYKQGIAVELCSDQGKAPCRLTESVPLGYVTYCKQKYVDVRLVALGENEDLYTDTFTFPSCCSCVYKYEDLGRTSLFQSSRSMSSATETRSQTNS